MIVVLDASAAVKLVLEESGSDQVRRLWNDWNERMTVVAPSIVAPEVAAAIQAARRGGRVADVGAQLAHQSWISLVGDIDVLAVDLALADRARGLAATRVVRGMDAVYLAVAWRSGPRALSGYCPSMCGSAPRSFPRMGFTCCPPTWADHWFGIVSTNRDVLRECP